MVWVKTLDVCQNDVQKVFNIETSWSHPKSSNLECPQVEPGIGNFKSPQVILIQRWAFKSPQVILI